MKRGDEADSEPKKRSRKAKAKESYVPTQGKEYCCCCSIWRRGRAATQPSTRASHGAYGRGKNVEGPGKCVIEVSIRA